jgi:hypothetical protein
MTTIRKNWTQNKLTATPPNLHQGLLHAQTAESSNGPMMTQANAVRKTSGEYLEKSTNQKIAIPAA